MNVVCEIVVFVDEVSNWYVRCLCNCFWEFGMNVEKVVVYEIFYEVFVIISKLIVLFILFVVEDIYLNLEGSSVYLVDYLVVNELLF